MSNYFGAAGSGGVQIPMIPSPHFASRNSHPIDTIVIHATGYGDKQTINDTINDMVDPAKKVSPHYLIGKEPGQIYQLVSDSDSAQQAASYNRRSIGIELYNKNLKPPLINTDPFTGWQKSALTNLVTDLIEKYNVPLDNVVRHGSIDPGHNWDPPQNFGWTDFKDGVKSELTTRVLNDLTKFGIATDNADNSIYRDQLQQFIADRQQNLKDTEFINDLGNILDLSQGEGDMNLNEYVNNWLTNKNEAYLLDSLSSIVQVNSSGGGINEPELQAKLKAYLADPANQQALNYTGIRNDIQNKLTASENMNGGDLVQDMGNWLQNKIDANPFTRPVDLSGYSFDPSDVELSEPTLNINQLNNSIPQISIFPGLAYKLDNNLGVPDDGQLGHLQLQTSGEGKPFGLNLMGDDPAQHADNTNLFPDDGQPQLANFEPNNSPDPFGLSLGGSSLQFDPGAGDQPFDGQNNPPPEFTPPGSGMAASSLDYHLLNDYNESAPFNAENPQNPFGMQIGNNQLHLNSDIGNGTMLANNATSNESPNFQQTFNAGSTAYQPNFANNLGIYTAPAYKPDFAINDGANDRPLDLPPSTIADTAQAMLPNGGNNAFSMSPAESNMPTGEMANTEPAFSCGAG